MKHQELLHLHALLAYTRQYCETDLPLEVEPSHFEAYEQFETKAFHLNAKKSAHEEALSHLISGFRELLDDNDTEQVHSTIGDDSVNDGSTTTSRPSPPSGSMDTGIRDQFVVEENTTGSEGTLWAHVDTDAHKPPDSIESSPAKKQSLTIDNGTSESEESTSDDERKQRSLTDEFSERPSPSPP